MNLELIKEINDLKLANHSYTEIAETTGMARASIVLSLRLSTLFEQSHALQTSSLQNEIDRQQSTAKALEKSIADQDTEIKRLNALVVFSEDDMVISKDAYKILKNELVGYKKKVDTLNRQLENEINYLDNLSFSDKIKLLFL